MRSIVEPEWRYLATVNGISAHGSTIDEATKTAREKYEFEISENCKLVNKIVNEFHTKIGFDKMKMRTLNRSEFHKSVIDFISAHENELKNNNMTYFHGWKKLVKEKIKESLNKRLRAYQNRCFTYNYFAYDMKDILIT